MVQNEEDNDHCSEWRAKALSPRNSSDTEWAVQESGHTAKPNSYPCKGHLQRWPLAGIWEIQLIKHSHHFNSLIDESGSLCLSVYAIHVVYAQVEQKGRERENSLSPPMINWDIGLLLSSDWDYTTGSLGSPSSWQQIMEPLSLRNDMSQFFIITPYLSIHSSIFYWFCFSGEP